jgi:hypothetical protein
MLTRTEHGGSPMEQAVRLLRRAGWTLTPPGDGKDGEVIEFAPDAAG